MGIASVQQLSGGSGIESEQTWGDQPVYILTPTSISDDQMVFDTSALSAGSYIIHVELCYTPSGCQGRKAVYTGYMNTSNTVNDGINSSGSFSGYRNERFASSWGSSTSASVKYSITNGSITVIGKSTSDVMHGGLLFLYPFVSV